MYPKYQLKAGDNLTTYEFLSEGSTRTRLYRMGITKYLEEGKN